MNAIFLDTWAFQALSDRRDPANRIARERVRQAMRLRASDYINKPFDIGTMKSAVARALERRSTGINARHSAEKLEELKSELHHRKCYFRLDAYDYRSRSAEPDHLCQIAHGPRSEGIHYVQNSDIDDHAL